MLELAGSGSAGGGLLPWWEQPANVKVDNKTIVKAIFFMGVPPNCEIPE
ncbi:hypothetical protein RV10_GL000803 [Enterococcus pallens]|nr:hypothetical protein RV10_GL000803 [Enterococcus pallens]